jgi:hypothetical protein
MTRLLALIHTRSSTHTLIHTPQTPPRTPHSFPSTALVIRQQKIRELEEQVVTLEAKRDAHQATIAAETAAGKGEEAEGRRDLLTTWHAAQARKARLTQDLVAFRDCDPTLLDAKAKAAQLALDAANRWTDNLFTLQDYVSRQFGMTHADFCSQFGVPVDLDNL